MRRIPLALLLMLALLVTGCGGDDDDETPTTSRVSTPTVPAPAPAPAPDTTETAPPVASTPTPPPATVTVPPRTTESGSGPSHATYVAQLNALCRTVNGRIASVNTQINTASDARDFAGLAKAFGTANEIYDDAVPKLQKLKAPAQDEVTSRNFENAVLRQRDIVGQLEEAAKKKDATQIKRLIALANGQTQLRKSAARAIGASDCGS